MQYYCKRLNKLIDEKKEGFLNKVNKIMCNIYEDGGMLYWDREIYVNCGFDDERARNLVRKTDLVMFEPSDDPEEHPGVVVRYKNREENS